MPKGRTAPRQLDCRACGEPFVTDRLGRAAYFCRRPECVEARAQAQRRRDSARRLSDEERARRDRERDEQRQAEARERFEQREAERVHRERRRIAAAKRRDVERLEQLAQGIADTLAQRTAELDDARRDLARLEGRPVPTPGPARPAPRPAPTEPLPGADVPAVPIVGRAGDLLEDVRRRAIMLTIRGGNHRAALGAAVRRLGRAQGLTGTRQALDDLAAVAIAWRLSVPERMVQEREADVTAA